MEVHTIEWHIRQGSDEARCPDFRGPVLIGHLGQNRALGVKAKLTSSPVNVCYVPVWPAGSTVI